MVRHIFDQFAVCGYKVRVIQQTLLSPEYTQSGSHMSPKSATTNVGGYSRVKFLVVTLE